MHLTSQPLTRFLISVRCFDEVLMPNTGGALCLCWGQQRNCCGVPHSSSSAQPRQPSHGLHTTGAMQPFKSRKISDRLMETGIKEGVSSAVQMLHYCIRQSKSFEPLFCYITQGTGSWLQQDRQHQLGQTQADGFNVTQTQLLPGTTTAATQQPTAGPDRDSKQQHQQQFTSAVNFYVPFANDFCFLDTQDRTDKD